MDHRYRNKNTNSNTNNVNNNRIAKNNYLKIFIFLFLIMMVFIIASRFANAEAPYFVAVPLSPDTDTKVKLQWSSVANADEYRLLRNDGSGTGYNEIKVINVGLDLNTLSYTDQGLRPGTTYTYLLRAYNVGVELTEMHSVAVTTGMIRPYGLKAVFDVNTRTASLMWGSSAVSEGSKIKKVISGVSEYINTTNKESADIKITEAGTAVFSVQTMAQSAGYGISAASEQITFVLAVPPVISAEYINAETVQISWDRQTYTDLFILECSVWEGTKWSDWYTINTSLAGTGTSHAAAEGGRYRYRLKAKEDRGYTGFSNITDYVNNLAAPTELSGRITEAGRIDLSWINAQGNEGKLQVWRRADGSSGSNQYSLIATLGSSENTYSDLFSITPGTVYHYRVNAADDSGHYSSYASASIAASIPAAPSSLRANVASESGIALEWNDNSNNEIGFIIERFDENEMKFVDIDEVVSNVTGYVDDTAVQGEAYIYRVCAINGIGRSARSNEVTVNAWDTAAPASLIVEAVSPTRLDLAWSYTATENYNTIIERKTGAEGTWAQIYTTPSGSLKYSDTGLTPGTRYFSRVRKSLGTGVAGAPFPDQTGTGAYTLLATPVITGAASSDNSIHISWSGVNASDVVIERKMPNGSFAAIMTAGPTASGWYDNTGLVPGAFYTYRVKAKTSTNESLYSDELVVQNYYLNAPSSLSISVKQDSEAILSWYDTTTDETGFEIWRYTHGGGAYVLYATADKNVTTFTDDRIDKGVQYSYRVRAFTGSGNIYSGFSNTASIGVGLIKPPADFDFDYVSEYQVLLHWTDTSDNEYGFIVEQKTGDDSGWKEVEWLPANRTSYTVSNLNKHTKYYFRIRAYNYQVHVDSLSEEILVSTAKPAEPSDVTAESRSASQVKITWKDNSDSEDGFIILRSALRDRMFTQVGETSKNVTVFYDDSVRAGSRYYYKVAAYSTAGSSESKIAQVTTSTKVFFTDTHNVSWAEDAIENLAGMGIIKGAAGTTLFKPGNTITKAEFTAIIVRAFELDTAPVGSLADVTYNKWYHREVMIAENLGIISGDKNNRFYPETPITREEIAVMVYKALQVSERRFNVHDNSVLEKFIDKQNISPDAVSSMAVLAGEGIMEGLQGNAIGPQYPATRAQAAVFVYRALIKSEPAAE